MVFSHLMRPVFLYYFVSLMRVSTFQKSIFFGFSGEFNFRWSYFKTQRKNIVKNNGWLLLYYLHMHETIWIQSFPNVYLFKMALNVLWDIGNHPWWTWLLIHSSSNKHEIKIHIVQISNQKERIVKIKHRQDIIYNMHFIWKKTPLTYII